MAGRSCRGGALADAISLPSATNETFATRTPAKSTGGDRTFPRSSRILRSADFRHVYDHGFRVSGPLFAAFCKAREIDLDGATSAPGPRIGLTVPRALGPAVVRNRLKRRLREAFRLHRAELAPKWDIVLNPRRALLEAPFGAVQSEIMRLIEKCNSR
jgi:ribonuclease P protein component